jgi:hypothetical protein
MHDASVLTKHMVSAVILGACLPLAQAEGPEDPSIHERRSKWLDGWSRQARP